MTLDSLTMPLVWVCLPSFFYRIADTIVGASYLTTLASLNNLGLMINNTIGLYLIGFVD